MNRIIKIDEYTNARLLNKNDGKTRGNTNVLKVYFENGDIRLLDMVHNKDFTDVLYYEMLVIDGITSMQTIFETDLEEIF